MINIDKLIVHLDLENLISLYIFYINSQRISCNQVIPHESLMFGWFLFLWLFSCLVMTYQVVNAIFLQILFYCLCLTEFIFLTWTYFNDKLFWMVQCYKVWLHRPTFFADYKLVSYSLDLDVKNLMKQFIR